MKSKMELQMQAWSVECDRVRKQYIQAMEIMSEKCVRIWRGETVYEVQTMFDLTIDIDDRER